MDVRVKVGLSGVDLSTLDVWDAQAMAEVCAWSVATVVERTTQRGVGANGRGFDAYSPRGPIWVSKASETGKRLTPKGGTPSKSGKSRRYADYADFKRQSRRGSIASAEVDLTLSGQLMREVDAISANAEEGIVSIRGQARDYGVHVNAARPFLGHHDGELDELDGQVQASMNGAIARHGGGKGGAPSGSPVL